MRHTDEQYDKLVKLLNWLKENNTFWRNSLSKYDTIDFSNIRDIYSSLPVIDKNLILNNLDTYIDPSFLKLFSGKEELSNYLLETNDLTRNHDKHISNGEATWVIETTTGTTGKPFAIVKSRKELFVAGNELLRCRRQYYDKATIENGFLLAHEVDDQIKQMDYRNEKSDMHDIIDYFLEKQPKWMFVSVNSLKRLANAMSNYRTNEVKKVDIRFIEVTGAKLYLEDRKRVEKIFKCPIVNQYGCREAWNIAYECKCGKLHVNSNGLMVDLVDENGIIIQEENKVGEVIITNLNAKTTPFVKYYLGDYASLSYEKCECGKDTPILALESGRKCELLKNTKYFGTDVFRKVLRVLYFSKGVRYNKVKIVQDEEYHLTVYLDGCSDKALFESKFIEVSKVIIDGFEPFGVSFEYDYPFFNENSFLKEQTFINKL